MYSNQDIGPNFDSHEVEEIGHKSPTLESNHPSLGEPKNEKAMADQILQTIFEELHQELVQESEEDNDILSNINHDDQLEDSQAPFNLLEELQSPRSLVEM